MNSTLKRLALSGPPTLATVGAAQTRLVNPALASSWVQPTNGTLVEGSDGAQGVVIIAALRAPIYAVHDGFVRQAVDNSERARCSSDVGQSTEGGWSVEIAHPDGTRTRYSQLVQRPSVSAGDIVRTGQVIGYVGSSGDPAGPTLHFEAHDGPLRRDVVDPVAYLAARGIELGGVATTPTRRSRSRHRQRVSLRRITGMVIHRRTR